MLDRSDPEQARRADLAKERLFKQTIALDGTLSGEHGIGFSKSPYLGFELNDATIGLMTRIKHLFDPNNILNPGKIFPDRPSSSSPAGPSSEK
jgi:glycolate oxidase